MFLLTKEKRLLIQLIISVNVVRITFFVFFFVFLNFYDVGSINAQPALPFTLKKCWESSILTKKLIYASDKIESIFILINENKIQSIDSLSGQVNWTFEIGGKITSNFIVSGNILYFASLIEIENDNSNAFNNESGIIHLRSINIQTGIPLWSTRIAASLYDEGSSKESTGVNNRGDEKIYLGQEVDNIFLLDSSGNSASVQKEHGTLEWLKKIESSPIFFFNFSFEAFQPSLPLMKTLAFYTTDNKFYLTDTRTGKILYQIPRLQLTAAAVISDSKNLVTGDAKGNISLTNIKSGNKNNNIWNIKIGGGISSLTPTNNNILVTSLDNFVYSINYHNGKQIWKKRLSGRLLYKPLIIEEKKLFTVVENNTAYFISLENGKILNQLSLSPEVYFISNPILVNNQYIFHTNTGLISYSEKTCLQ